MVLCGELGTGTEPVRDSGPGVLRLSLSPVLEDHVPPPGASHAFGLLHCFLAPKACLVQSTLKGNQWDHRYVCAESPVLGPQHLATYYLAQHRGAPFALNPSRELQFC